MAEITVWQVQEWDDGELMDDKLFADETVARMYAIQLIHSFMLDDNLEVEWRENGDDEWIWQDDEFWVILGQREVQ